MPVTTEEITKFTKQIKESLKTGASDMVDAFAIGFNDMGQVLFQFVLCNIVLDLEPVIVVGMNVVSRKSCLHPYNDTTDINRFVDDDTIMNCGGKKLWTISLNRLGPGNHCCDGQIWDDKKRVWMSVPPPTLTIFATNVGDDECIFRYFKSVWCPMRNDWKVIIITSADPLIPILCREKRCTEPRRRYSSERRRPFFNGWECRHKTHKCCCSYCSLHRDGAGLDWFLSPTIMIQNPNCDCMDGENHDCSSCECDCHRKCDCNRKCNSQFPCECYCHRNSGGEASDGNDDVGNGDSNSDWDPSSQYEWQPTPECWDPSSQYEWQPTPECWTSSKFPYTNGNSAITEDASPSVYRITFFGNSEAGEFNPGPALFPPSSTDSLTASLRIMTGNPGPALFPPSSTDSLTANLRIITGNPGPGWFPPPPPTDPPFINHVRLFAVTDNEDSDSDICDNLSQLETKSVHSTDDDGYDIFDNGYDSFDNDDNTDGYWL